MIQGFCDSAVCVDRGVFSSNLPRPSMSHDGWDRIHCPYPASLCPRNSEGQQDDHPYGEYRSMKITSPNQLPHIERRIRIADGTGVGHRSGTDNGIIDRLTEIVFRISAESRRENTVSREDR